MNAKKKTEPEGTEPDVTESEDVEVTEPDTDTVTCGRCSKVFAVDDVAAGVECTHPRCPMQ